MNMTNKKCAICLIKVDKELLSENNWRYVKRNVKHCWNLLEKMITRC